MQGLIGTTIGRYRVTEHLGRGGMAEVYKAYQPSLDRYVAIKLMHAFLADDKDFLTRFEREAKVVATLRHPNIVQVHDFDVDNGQYYMVMEYIDGVTLKTMLEQLHARGEWLTLSDATNIILSVGSALRYAHERNMVHRDVKPANVMITRDGHVILTDFGIAKIMSATNLTVSGAMVGTPSYMSPEQGMGEPGDERSDIYSIGVMLYQLAVGRLPYDADTPLAVVLKHINEPLPIPRALKPDLPEEVERIILKALAKNPDDRYPTVGEMTAELKHAMGLAADITPTESMKGGSAIKLSSSTVIGRIGAATPPPPGASPTSTVSRLGAGSTVARAATPGASEAAVAPTPITVGRPKWLAPAMVVVALALGGGGIALFAASGTASPTPTPTLTLAPTAAVTPSATAFVPPVGRFTTDAVVAYSGPSIDSPVVGQLDAGSGEFVVVARSADSKLLKIQFRDGTTYWVLAEGVDLGNVSLSAIPPAVTLTTLTPTPTVTPAPTDTAIPTETPPPTNTPAPTRPPATRAPATATQPPAPTATPTTAGFPDVDFGWERLGDAVRSGDDWVETVRIDPRGGDGTYVVFYQDVQVFGPPFFIQIRARGNRDGAGCRNLPTSLRVGSAGKSVQKDLFFEAPPGCASWWP
ncbi:MAG TPA: protein kinase [Anaerolineae bacterium]|nr:protein kinase [Anaerolineae bacterium]